MVSWKWLWGRAIYRVNNQWKDECVYGALILLNSSQYFIKKTICEIIYHMCIFNARTRKILSSKHWKQSHFLPLLANMLLSSTASTPASLILWNTLWPNMYSAKPKKKEGREGGRDRRKKLSLKAPWQKEKGRKAKNILWLRPNQGSEILYRLIAFRDLKASGHVATFAVLDSSELRKL